MSQLNDDELGGLISEAVTPDRDVPPEWREAAHAAYTWRTIDHELMALTHDSSHDAVGAVRREDDSRTIAFTGGGLTLEVEVSDGRILGQLATPVAGQVTFESSDGRSRSVVTNQAGFFSLAGEDHGLVRFALDAARQALRHRVDRAVT